MSSDDLKKVLRRANCAGLEPSMQIELVVFLSGSSVTIGGTEDPPLPLTGSDS